MTDNIGNVRAVINSQRESEEVRVESFADYYSFGLPMPGQHANTQEYELDYQGQRKDAEIGFNAFELRMFDTRIGRWMAPDPYEQHWSPYLAMSNNPIQFIDPDGGSDVNPNDAYTFETLEVSECGTPMGQMQRIDYFNMNVNGVMGGGLTIKGEGMEVVDFGGMKGPEEFFEVFNTPYAHSAESYEKANQENPNQQKNNNSSKTSENKQSLKSKRKTQLKPYSSNTILAELYFHFQTGGGKPFIIDAKTIDFNASKKKLGLSEMKKGESKEVNLFDLGINPHSLAFGKLKFTYIGGNNFKIKSNTFDFDYQKNRSKSRNLGTALGFLVNYNIIFLNPTLPLIPIVFGGPFDVVFEGEITVE